MEHLCTGHYMNYYSNQFDVNFDLFIIINEGNYEAVEPLGLHDLEDADRICTEYCTGKEMNSDECRELELLLEEVFEYGVQVFKR